MEDKKPKPLPQDLIINQDGTATYTIAEEGDVLGSYKGVFVFKCYLSPLDSLSANRAFRELLGPFAQEATDTDRWTAYALTQLQKRVIKAPPWWQTDSALPGNIPDHNVLSTILDRAADAEIAYRERLKEKRTDTLKKVSDATKAIQERLNEAFKTEEKSEQ